MVAHQGGPYNSVTCCAKVFVAINSDFRCYQINGTGTIQIATLTCSFLLPIPGDLARVFCSSLCVTQPPAWTRTYTIGCSEMTPPSPQHLLYLCHFPERQKGGRYGKWGYGTRRCIFRGLKENILCLSQRHCVACVMINKPQHIQ